MQVLSLFFHNSQQNTMKLVLKASHQGREGMFGGDHYKVQYVQNFLVAS